MKIAIYIVEGHHYSQGGYLRSIHGTMREADGAAAGLVEIMRDDLEKLASGPTSDEEAALVEASGLDHIPHATAVNWKDVLRMVQARRMIWDEAVDDAFEVLHFLKTGEAPTFACDLPCDVAVSKEEVELSSIIERTDMSSALAGMAAFARDAHNVFLGSPPCKMVASVQPPAIDDTTPDQPPMVHRSPSGSPIVSIAQTTTSAWPITFEGGEHQYGDAPESVEWDSLILGGDLVMVDDNGEEWLERHVLKPGEPEPDAEAVDAMARAKRDAERREWLLSIARSYSEDAPDGNEDEQLFWLHFADKMFPALEEKDDA